jgi:hypothetical protein
MEYLLQNSRHAPRCGDSTVNATSAVGHDVVARGIAIEGVHRKIDGSRFGAKRAIGKDWRAGNFALGDVGRWVYSISVLARPLPELVGYLLFEPRGGDSG